MSTLVLTLALYAGAPPTVVPSPSAERPRGTYIMRAEPPPREPRFGPGPRHRILYMNRNGGTFTYGDDDSAANVSSIPYGTADVTGFELGDAAWGELMTCIRLMYSRFDLEITDVDPGDVDHIESVVGGYPQEVGMGSGVGGVAPMWPDCSVVERAIVFTFAGVYGDDVQSICETVAQESAHALGLDHEYMCEDPMTYLYGCGSKSFQDEDAPCGEYGARQCACGGSTQNSVQLFYQILGPNDSVPPEVEITEPGDGATVEPGFRIAVSATDDKGVTKVDLQIDGALAASAGAAPYDFTAPATLAAGPHTLTVQAYDAAGNVRTDTITVTRRADDGEDPPTPPPPEPGQPGSPCANGADCNSGLCATDGADTLCTQACASDADCPAGFACSPTASGGVCWPSGAPAGGGPDDGVIAGGCGVARRGERHGVWVVLLLAAALTGLLTLGKNAPVRGKPAE